VIARKSWRHCLSLSRVAKEGDNQTAEATTRILEDTAARDIIELSWEGLFADKAALILFGSNCSRKPRYTKKSARGAQVLGTQ
jgi:hypothetical protein